MILCQTCLTECPNDASFCVVCGEPLGARANNRTVPSPQTVTPDLQASGQMPASAAPVHPAWQPPATPPDPATAPPPGALTLRLSSGAALKLSGKREYLIGRRDVPLGIYPDADLAPYGGLEAGVGRRHAAIYLRPEGYFVEDLESTNETLLNFKRLLPRQLYPLKDGDELRFGLMGVLVVLN